MIQINNGKDNFNINFPTNVNEITADKLSAITESVILPNYHAIVALAFKTKIFDFVTAIGNENLNTTLSVIPLLAKINCDNKDDIKFEVGQKIVIERGALERGTHLNLNCSIASNFARKFFRANPDFSRAIIRKDESFISNNKLNKELLKAGSPEIILLEFKIVPITEIKASFMNNVAVKDAFIDYTIHPSTGN